MSRKSKEESAENNILTSQDQLKSFLKSNKESHYNFEDAIDYKVSSGSLLFDYSLDGGLGTGLHRFCGINEGGKEQPVSEPVLTPNGWTEIGKLKPGSIIFGSNGQTQTVLAVYPQGVKDVYEVEFDDGSKTRCGLEHLWETSNFQERHNSGFKSVKSLKQIISSLKYGFCLNHSVRVVEAINFNSSAKLLVDPYLLGTSIGKSDKKFIPDDYKFASINDRVSLLQGLIDTDGYINKSKSEILYYTVSEQLADDVLHIVRSLGGIARKRFKKSSYLDKDGERIICKNCFIISFYLPPEIIPAKLTRKIKNFSPRQKNFTHFIKKVTKIGSEESVCIKVSSNDSLYVTKDFILTHNTSSALQFMKNFLLTQKNGKGFYIKAEGRLSKEMIERSGVKFVFKPEEWVLGTCFVFESNIHETVFDAMRELIGKNDEKIRYFFLLDSVDGLIRKMDLDKTFEESQKVAGGAVIAADLMKRVSIALQKRGHIAIFISQVRADIKLDPYSKAPIRQTSATGGNALLHFANWIIEFEPRFSKDLILEDPNTNYDEHKNPYIGHIVKIVVKKSPNEKTNAKINYPIRYGRKNGTSNWIEKEILDLLFMWEIATKKGAWISFDEDFLASIKEAGFEDFPIQVQGAARFEKLINDNDLLKSFFINYIRKNILNFDDAIYNSDE
jgi:RecA/RadA recombinase